MASQYLQCIMKNKLYKAIGTPRRNFNPSVLIRDINDTYYPWKDKYKDFKSRPRCNHRKQRIWVHRKLKIAS